MAYVTRELCLEGLKGRRRRSKAYATLQNGRPKITTKVHHFIGRNDLIETVKELISPGDEPQGYPLITGEHGTGKTNLLWLALNDIKMKERRGIVYAKVPSKDELPFQLSQVIEEALGLNPSKCNGRAFSSVFWG